MFENTPVKYVEIWKPLPTENLLHDTDGVCYGRRFKGDKATPSATSRCGSLLPPCFLPTCAADDVVAFDIRRYQYKYSQAAYTFTSMTIVVVSGASKIHLSPTTTHPTYVASTLCLGGVVWLYACRCTVSTLVRVLCSALCRCDETPL